MKVSIKSVEYYLPQKTEDGRILKNDNPDWRIEEIEQKTGIIVRHIANSEQTVVDMAFFAAEKLFATGVHEEDIDFLILITQSPDYVLPTSACVLQDRLGLKKTCMAFDINLGCSGFIYGLAVGGSLIESRLAKKGMVICSEKYTKYIDKSDRTCRPIFSDGAAATLLSGCDNDKLGPFEMGTDGSGYSDLIVVANDVSSVSSSVIEYKLMMNGSKVFMFTMDAVPKCVNMLLGKAGKKISDIDLFIFHQASKMVIDSIVRRLKITEDKVFNNYHRVGNTVSASIPIAIKDAGDERRLRNGDQVMLVGFGVGYSWGACLVSWDGES